MKKRFYCPSCGRTNVSGGIFVDLILLPFDLLFGNRPYFFPCKMCGTKYKELPDEIAKKYYCFQLDQHPWDYDKMIESREQFYKDLILTNPNINVEAFNTVREEYISSVNELIESRAKREQENARIAAKNEACVAAFMEDIKNVPKCPTCGSKSVGKITTVDRAISIGVAGAASGKLGKTMECHNCGYKW